MAEKGWYTDFDESKVTAEKQRKFAVKKSIEKDMENTAAAAGTLPVTPQLRVRKSAAA